MPKATSNAKTLASAVDALYALRVKRQAKQRKYEEEIEALKDQERELEDLLIESLPASDAEGIIGKTAKAVIVVKRIPSAKDWDKVYKWIAKHKRFDMLQKRLNNKAICDMWENGKNVDGIEGYNAKSVSLTKNR